MIGFKPCTVSYNAMRVDDMHLKSPFETLFAWQDDDASGFGKSGFLSWKSEEQCGGGSGFLPKLAVSSL